MDYRKGWAMALKSLGGFDGGCVLITGATGGIGCELCREFSRSASSVILVGRNEGKLGELAASLANEFGVETRVFVADFADLEAAGKLAQQIRDAGLQIDVLVNNAGFGYDASFIESDWARQRELLQTNIMALVELCWEFAPDMAERGKGGILNVASVAGFMPGPYLSTYYASKAFVQSFTQSLHVELALLGVHVSALCPGPVRTPFWDNAGAGNTALAKMTIDASRVARSAVRALRANKAVCCPGALAKGIVFSSRLMPRCAIARIAARLQSPRSR